MEQPRCKGCQLVLDEVKALRDEVVALRGWLAQDRGSRRLSMRRWLRRLFFVYAVFMLYLLSIGPAVLLASKTGRGEGLMEVLYAPVQWLGDYVPLLDAPLDAYISLWYPEEAKE
jgi:hypothetical protein